ncbi:Unknown protein, partial [Striga hermonthica]
GPKAVAEWLQQLESIFDLLFTTDEVKIRCASFVMTGDARTWWNDYWRLHPRAERDALTWDQMVTIVKDKYYREAHRAQMMKDFWELKQGPRPVDVYERDFTRMCAFTPMLVDTDQKKAFRFRDGLRPDLCYTLTGHGALPYSEMVHRATELEVCQNAQRAAVPSYQQTPMIQPISAVAPGSNSGKMKADHFQNKKKGKKGNFGRRDDRPPQGQLPRCPNCGKFHGLGECRAAERHFLIAT